MAEGSIKIGLFMDRTNLEEEWRNVLQFTIGEYLEQGKIDRPIEVIERSACGFPWCPPSNVVRPWHELVAEDVMAIFGGCVGDNMLALAPSYAQTTVPSVAISATGGYWDRANSWLSEYSFSVPWHSEADSPYLLANWVWRHGYKTVAITYDTSGHGMIYLNHFRLAARRYNIKILTEEKMTAVPGELQTTQAREAVENAKRHSPDALVDLAMGARSSYSVAFFAREMNWDVPRIMAGNFYTCWDPKAAKTIEDERGTVLEVMEGWVGNTLVDPENRVASGFFERMALKYELPNPEFGRIVYDGARTLLEGIALAPVLTPRGVKEGLERVRVLPAASGTSRNSIGLGPYDHRGMKGMDLTVLARISDGAIVHDSRFEP